jgi:hypothetical protein
MWEKRPAVTAFEPGELAIITHGQYSSYGLLCVVRVLKPLNLERAMADWLEEHPEQKPQEAGSMWYNHLDEYAFVASLVRGGFIEEHRVRTIHLGGDSDGPESLYEETDRLGVPHG